MVTALPLMVSSLEGPLHECICFGECICVMVLLRVYWLVQREVEVASVGVCACLPCLTDRASSFCTLSKMSALFGANGSKSSSNSFTTWLYLFLILNAGF